MLTAARGAVAVQGRRPVWAGVRGRCAARRPCGAGSRSAGRRRQRRRRGPQRRGRYGSQTDQHPGAAAGPAGGTLLDRGDQEDLERLGLQARLIGADRLYAVSTGDVRAQDTVVLLDNDATSWRSWNVYAEQLAHDTGARTVHISDGGVTGPAFFDHVRRSRRPVINSPKGQAAPLPPDLVQRPVVTPEVYWTWSLVQRAGEVRSAVRAVVDVLCDGVGDLGIHAPGAWLPDGDAHRQ
ncbi:hypothetical protein OHA79_38545 [Streptomyces sp. NBC_00841]|uniref:hypothetical protein n=1 Tax=unclassified Streptomyces TaxID=2593676 RepID=UPI0022533485|nr:MULTISPECIES: hypothetical protein [unclassified Streptomyces]MCX4531206.1 hypothetical protein [Streptomyces sp. NBC_01669]WSA03207.1 hypothetical protein OHA79_38545 [Streptomyces sp. NBC_00841]